MKNKKKNNKKKTYVLNLHKKYLRAVLEGGKTPSDSCSRCDHLTAACQKHHNTVWWGGEGEGKQKRKDVGVGSKWERTQALTWWAGWWEWLFLAQGSRGMGGERWRQRAAVTEAAGVMAVLVMPPSCAAHDHFFSFQIVFLSPLMAPSFHHKHCSYWWSLSRSRAKI